MLFLKKMFAGKKKSILIIIVVIIAVFYVVDYAWMFITYETNIFKIPIQVTGIVKRGMHINPVSANYLESNDRGIYYLDDRFKKHQPFDCAINTIETCYLDKKVRINGYLTGQKIEIFIDQKKYQVQVLEVGSVTVEQ